MGNETFRYLVLTLLSFGVALHAHSAPPGPKITPSVSPEDYSEFRYHNHISNDFQNSDRFDLQDPIEVEVEIYRVSINDEGYAELLFRLPGDENHRLPEGMDPDTPIAEYRIATLQTPEEFKRLKLKENDFKNGVNAVLSGWPALPIQAPYSEMLVDEITFSNGKTYVFHQESEKMVKYKDKDKPRKKNETDLEESPPDSEASDG